LYDNDIVCMIKNVNIFLYNSINYPEA